MIAPIYTSYPTVQAIVLFNKTEVEVHLFCQAESDADAQKTPLMGTKDAETLGPAVFQ